jgi:toxin FitB
MVLDTNVVSELLRERPEPAVLDWFAARPTDGLYVAAVTQAEMLLGVRLLPAGKRRNALEQAVDRSFEKHFDGRVLPFDSHAALPYASIVASRRRAGRPIGQFDAQIAAIALIHGMKLVTRNVGDFEGCGLGLTNPWVDR